MQWDVITNQLQRLKEQQAALHECRLAHLRELARLLFCEFSDTQLFFLDDDFLRRYREETRITALSVAQTPKEHAEDLRRQERRIATEDAVYFCRALLAYYRGAHGAAALSPEAFCVPREAEQFPFETDRIAYLKNAFADLAYSKFSRILPDAVVSYCDDFNAVCEEVSLGRARYGILPLENSADGRLKSFHALLDRYDLKIVLLCEVPVGQSVTQFALFGRRVAVLDCGRYRQSSFLELRLHLSRTEELSCVLSAASYYGLRLTRSSSTEREQGAEFDLIFSLETADVSAFLCYLTLEFPQFEPIGLYTKLKN